MGPLLFLRYVFPPAAGGKNHRFFPLSPFLGQSLPGRGICSAAFFHPAPPGVVWTGSHFLWFAGSLVSRYPLLLVFSCLLDGGRSGYSFLEPGLSSVAFSIMGRTYSIPHRVRGGKGWTVFSLPDRRVFRLFSLSPSAGEGSRFLGVLPGGSARCFPEVCFLCESRRGGPAITVVERTGDGVSGGTGGKRDTGSITVVYASSMGQGEGRAVLFRLAAGTPGRNAAFCSALFREKGLRVFSTKGFF